MLLIEHPEGPEIREIAYKFSLLRFAIAAAILVWFTRQNQGAPLTAWPQLDGFGWVIVAGLLVTWGYFGLAWRSWRFNLQSGELVMRTRNLLHARSRRIPMANLRRVVLDPTRSGKSAYLLLIHSGGLEQYRNHTTSAEYGDVKRVALRLQELLQLDNERFPEDAIIKEVLKNSGVTEACRVTKRLKQLSLKQSREYVAALG